jgi:hypothetical protein
MTPEIKKTLDLALEKINKAREKVAALCDGKERWTMSVPVRPDYDHDVVISGALSVAEDAIKQAQMQTVQEPVAWLDPTDGAIIKAHVFKDVSTPEGWRPIGFIDNLPAAPVQEPQDGELIRGYFEADYTTCYRHADLTWDPVLETYKNERTRAAWHGWQCCTRNTPPAAQPAQEPVATVKAKRDGGGTFVHWTQLPVAGMKLYTAAQPAPTVQEPVGHYAGDHKVRLYCDVPKGARLYTTRTSTSTCAADT